MSGSSFGSLVALGRLARSAGALRWQVSPWSRLPVVAAGRGRGWRLVGPASVLGFSSGLALCFGSSPSAAGAFAASWPLARRVLWAGLWWVVVPVPSAGVPVVPAFPSSAVLSRFGALWWAGGAWGWRPPVVRPLPSGG